MQSLGRRIHIVLSTSLVWLAVLAVAHAQHGWPYPDLQKLPQSGDNYTRGNGQGHPITYAPITNAPITNAQSGHPNLPPRPPMGGSFNQQQPGSAAPVQPYRLVTTQDLLTEESGSNKEDDASALESMGPAKGGLKSPHGAEKNRFAMVCLKARIRTSICTWRTAIHRRSLVESVTLRCTKSGERARTPTLVSRRCSTSSKWRSRNSAQEQSVRFAFAAMRQFTRTWLDRARPVWSIPSMFCARV